MYKIVIYRPHTRLVERGMELVLISGGMNDDDSVKVKTGKEGDCKLKDEEPGPYGSTTITVVPGVILCLLKKHPSFIFLTIQSDGAVHTSLLIRRVWWASDNTCSQPDPPNFRRNFLPTLAPPLLNVAAFSEGHIVQTLWSPSSPSTSRRAADSTTSSLESDSSNSWLSSPVVADSACCCACLTLLRDGRTRLPVL